MDITDFDKMAIPSSAIGCKMATEKMIEEFNRIKKHIFGAQT